MKRISLHPALRHNSRGDTLIEVLLSLAILSLIIITGNAMMNFGMQSAITATEHTQVRNLIVAQAELLRYLRDNATESGADHVSTTWRTITRTGPGGYSVANASPATTCDPTSNSSTKPFYVTAAFPTDGTDTPLTAIEATGYTGAPDPDNHPYAVAGDGLWVEAVKPTTPNQDYVDFHIRACWGGSGSGIPQHMAQVVRLRVEGERAP